MVGVEVTCKKAENVAEFKHLIPAHNYTRNVNKSSKKLTDVS
jgi:hypothetical protein